VQRIANADVEAITHEATKIATNNKTATNAQSDTKAAIKESTQTKANTAAQAKIDAELKQQAQSKTKTQPETQTKAQTQVKTATETAVERATRTKVSKTTQGDDTVPKRPIKGGKAVIKLTLPTGEVLRLKSDEYAGIVAWKQGAFYIMKWYPYDKPHTRYTTKPIEGVKYHDGVGSAAKSIVALKGEIPANIRFDMGIQDVNIFRGKGGQPGIRFTLDRNVRQGRRPIIRESADIGRVKKS
jgi:hypothetical protein